MVGRRIPVLHHPPCPVSQSGAAKEVKRPAILALPMPEDVSVAVIRTDLETAIPYAVPLIEDFLDLVGARTGLLREGEPKRSLVSPITGITFDLKFQVHRQPSATPCSARVRLIIAAGQDSQKWPGSNLSPHWKCRDSSSAAADSESQRRTQDYSGEASFRYYSPTRWPEPRLHAGTLRTPRAAWD